MDPASPSSNLSTASSVGLEAHRQPTYTTVGSVYNPNAAMPLQPPTRRPRTRRYPQPVRSPSGNTFFPFTDALLSALPLKDSAPLSLPTTAATFRQYSPIQQNYDRAASPITEQGISAFSSTGMSASVIRSGNTPSPVECEDIGNVGSEDTLATSRITVKGLTNLASYPNPMQKAARNALARARTANLGLTRPNTPSSLSSSTFDMGKDRLGSTYGTTAAATGPPQPLTAGPPGQRQFRTVTVDTAPNCLRKADGISPLSPMASEFQSRSLLGLSRINGPGLLPTSNDDDELGGTGRQSHLPTDERYDTLFTHRSSGHAGSQPLPTPGPSDMMAIEALVGARRKVHDTLPAERIAQYFPDGFPSNYDGRHKPTSESWYTKYPTMDGKSMFSLSERRSKINRNFYAGTEGLVKNIDQIVRDHNYRCLENKVGVIGEERARRRGSHNERSGCDGKARLPHLSV